MIFPLLFCLIAFVIFLFFVGVNVSAWRKLGGTTTDLTNDIWQEAQRLAPAVVLWATFGSGCGLIGVFIMTRVAGISMAEAGGWIWLGIGPGLVWGVIWGIIYGITDRKQD